MDTERKQGSVVKWIPFEIISGRGSGGWGIINSYNAGGGRPLKYFFHRSGLQEGAIPKLGDRVSFLAGPARSENELPTATDIEIIPAINQAVS